MLKFQIQYQKVDKYRNDVFICRPDNKETYSQLENVNSKLESTYENVTSPIYINEEHEYITLRTLRNPKYSFKEKNTYDITVQFKHKKNNDDKEFINAVLTKSKCIERFTEDNGNDISLDL